MKTNKIRTYKINNKYIAYYMYKYDEYLIKPDKLPSKLVKNLMKNQNAGYFEIKKWIKFNYDINLK